MSLTAKNRSIANPIALIAVCAGLSGCAALDSEYGRPLPLDNADEYESGTHYSQVLDRLGPPTQMSRLGAGMVLEYRYIDLSERQYGFMLPGKIGKWFKFVYATGDVYTESMQFIIDGQGALTSVTSDSQTMDGGGGFSATLIFSVGSLTSIEQYRADAANSGMWGMGLTYDPLRVLNSRQTLDTGENGLESIGVSQSVGQETLELGDSYIN